MKQNQKGVKMKKHALLLTLVIAVLSMSLVAQEIKISGEMWNRWTMDSGTTAADTMNTSIRSNTLSLERGYFGLEAKFTETVKGRFTVDMFSTDALKDGAGLKLKYAYVDFANVLPIPDSKITVGLQKVYFGSIYDWDYTIIGKAPTDEYKIANSADYGISLNGYLPSGLGDYALGIYNGEGYKNWGQNLKNNTELAYLANVRLTPIPGLSLGGSFMTNSSEREESITTGAVNAAYNRQMLADGLARIAFGPLDLWAEYISKSVEYPNVAAGTADYSANGLMVMPIVSLKNYLGKDIQILGRWDRWDETDNSVNRNLSETVTAGINYNFMHNESAVPAMQLQLNYSNRTYDADESAASYANGLKDYAQLMLQLKWRFSNTIK